MYDVVLGVLLQRRQITSVHGGIGNRRRVGNHKRSGLAAGPMPHDRRSIYRDHCVRDSLGLGGSLDLQNDLKYDSASAGTSTWMSSGGGQGLPGQRSS